MSGREVDASCCVHRVIAINRRSLAVVKHNVARRQTRRSYTASAHLPLSCLVAYCTSITITGYGACSYISCALFPFNALRRIDAVASITVRAHQSP